MCSFAKKSVVKLKISIIFNKFFKHFYRFLKIPQFIELFNILQNICLRNMPEMGIPKLMRQGFGLVRILIFLVWLLAAKTGGTN